MSPPGNRASPSGDFISETPRGILSPSEPSLLTKGAASRMNMTATVLHEYLERTDPDEIHPGFLAYLANLSQTATVAPEVARLIVRELADQRRNLKLIASENYCSLATQLAMGNLLTDKYAEGYPGNRFYEGCENIDAIESYACDQAGVVWRGARVRPAAQRGGREHDRVLGDTFGEDRGARSGAVR